jgi:hypothetical protein
MDEPSPDQSSVRLPGVLSGNRRKRRLLCGAAAAVIVSALGMVAATAVKSPQQVAAESRPPKASAITTPVTREVLTSTVLVRGTVVPRATVTVTGTAPAGAIAIVTKATVKQGDLVNAGQVVAEVSDRPVIALPGRIPAFRDLQVGATGTDVDQLHTALTSLGYLDGDSPGTFGPGTVAAVTELYADAGYPVPTTTGDGTSGSGGNAGSSPGRNSPGIPTSPPRQVYLPRAEIVYVPKLPATVTAPPLAVGQSAASTPVLTLAAGGLAVQATIPQEERGLVRVGMRVEIYSEVLDRKIAGHVSGVGLTNPNRAGTNGGQPQNGIPMTVDAAIPTGMNGQDVRLTVTAASTGTRVLVVPVAAVYSAANSTTQVNKVGPGGAQVKVAVTAGATGNGYVQVKPANAGDLREGDRVVIGQ